MADEYGRIDVALRLQRGVAACVCVTLLPVLILGPAGAAQAKAMTRSAQRMALRSRTLKVTNNSLRYLHTTWFARNYPAYETTVAPHYAQDGSVESTSLVEVLPARTASIRAQASTLYATAIALNKAYYRPSSVKVSSREALHRTVAWTNDLAISYDRDHWGKGWQSALWTSYLGLGSRQVWKYLPQATKELVERDVAAEADHLLTLPPPYYQDASGTVLHPGDSKSEEDSWNAALLLLAARDFPSNPHAPDWDRQGRWYALLACASPQQVGTDSRIVGSNLNADGTVTNHNRVNPDYMFSMTEMVAKVSIECARTGSAVPTETMNNLGAIWYALNNRMFQTAAVATGTPLFRLPGGTIYRRGKNRTPTARMYYPNGPDWSSVRRFNAAEMDVEVFAARLDPKSYGWAKAHLDFVLHQQARHKDGRMFSLGETRFPEDEQFAAASAAEMTYRLSSMR